MNRLLFTFSSLVLVAVHLGACGSKSDGDEPAKPASEKSVGLEGAPSDDALCATYCERLPATCAAAAQELKGADCKAASVDGETSNEFKQCLAEATSSDGLND